MDRDQKLTFGQLSLGDHFIAFPLPGDNSGHGGYLGAHRLFVKTGGTDSVDGRGVESSCPRSMFVIRVMLG